MRNIGLNSALLGLFSTSCTPSFSGHGYTTRRPANTSCPRSGRFRLLELRVFSTNLNILRSICSGHGDPARRAAATAAPQRFTEVVPTPHAYSGQWPVKTKRARARSCASVVTRKRPSLNRAEKTSESLLERNCSAVGKTAKSLLPTPSTTRAIRPGSTSP